MSSLEWVYGIHAVLALLKNHPDRIKEIYLVDERQDAKFQEILTLAKQQGLVIQHAHKKQLDTWTNFAVHQGILAKRIPHKIQGEEELIELLQSLNQPPFLLALDGIQDPHNLGACLRTCDAAGVTAVIIPKDKSAHLTPLVSKIASGAAETVPVIEVTNLVRCLNRLKKEGIWIIGSSLNAKQSLFKTDLKGPITLVLGSEGEGLRRLTEETCDILMKLPMLGSVQSLNVSVAAGICLYEALRQRS